MTGLDPSVIAAFSKDHAIVKSSMTFGPISFFHRNINFYWIPSQMSCGTRRQDNFGLAPIIHHH